MKGRPYVPPEDDDPTAHGTDCPSCDGGTLQRKAALAVKADLAAQNKLVNVTQRAKYVYVCDSCDYMEEVVRNAEDD
jgi:predicted nucleic acid-binding Zn ribbon protein